MADSTPFSWSDALKYIIPGAISATGAILTGKAQSNQNNLIKQRTAEEDQLARDEFNRRQMYSNLVLPSLLQALGRKDPNLLKQVAISQSFSPSGTPAPNLATSPVGGFSVPNTAGGGLGSVVGNGMSGALTGAMLGSKIGAIGGPVGMAIGAGVGTLGSLASKLGADEENQWVNKVQNPFGQQVAQIMDPETQARNAGTLTKDQVIAAQKALEDKINEYNTAAQQYSGQGAKQAATINQSYNTLNPIFKSWRDSLTTDLGRFS